MPTIENTGATQVAQTQAIVANQNLADNSEVVGQTSDARTVTQTTETKSFCRKVLDVLTFPFRKIYQFACYVCNKIRNFVRGNKEASLNKTEDQQKVENNQADTSKAKTLPQANATKEVVVKENGKSDEENKISASSLAKNQAGVTVVEIPSSSEDKKASKQDEEVSDSSNKASTGNKEPKVEGGEKSPSTTIKDSIEQSEVVSDQSKKKTILEENKDVVASENEEKATVVEEVAIKKNGDEQTSVHSLKESQKKATVVEEVAIKENGDEQTSVHSLKESQKKLL